jgi:nitrate reductase beta subunit
VTTVTTKDQFDWTPMTDRTFPAMGDYIRVELSHRDDDTDVILAEGFVAEVNGGIRLLAIGRYPSGFVLPVRWQKRILKDEPTQEDEL